MPIPPDATLADAGEFGLIAALVSRFRQGEQVLVGPGDDAAVLRVPHRPRGGLHRPDGRGPPLPPRLGLGDRRRPPGGRAEPLRHQRDGRPGHLAHHRPRRARPTCRRSGRSTSPTGSPRSATLVGASVVGGDLTRSDQIVIAVTVIGACTQAPVLRSGARPGDVLALAGRQGWAAGGLAVLGRGFRSPRVLVEAYRRPEPPYDAGPAGRRRRRHRDDRRLRRPARRRRPPRRRLGRRHRRTTGRRSRSPSRWSPSAPRPAPTRSSSSSAAETTTRCWRRSPTRARCRTAGR